MSEQTVALRFHNREATPPITCLRVSRSSVEPIMAWYGAYYAGDEYTVTINGKEVPHDMNGELEPLTIDCQSRRNHP